MKTQNIKQTLKTKTMDSIIKNSKVVLAGVLVSVIGTFTVFADFAALPSAQDGLDQALSRQNSAQLALEQAQKQLEATNTEVCVNEKLVAAAKLKDYHNSRYELLPEENILDITRESQKDCGVPVGQTEQLHPEDLYYTFKKTDGTYVTQSPKEHFKRNGYMATDVGTDGKKLTMYAPSFMFHKDGQLVDESREYTVKLAGNYGTMGQTIELHWQEDGANYNWAIGHSHEIWVQDGDTVKTGDPIGKSGGCPGELKLEEKSTGCHVHIELRIDGQAIEYPLNNNTKHNDVGLTQVSDNVKKNEESIHSYDMDKLAYAIAQAETNDCTKGMGKTKANCFGMMHWPNGPGSRTGINFLVEGKTFEEAKADSYVAFKEMWKKSYDTPLTFESVYAWVYGPNAPRTQARINGANQYLSNALHHYNKQ